MTTRASTRFIRRVEQTLRRHQMLAPGQHVLAAVSGGADSVALLAGLHQLAAGRQLRLTVAHLNHGLRGRDSAGDTAFVRELANRWQLPVVVKRLPPGALQQTGQSMEMAARTARYAFLVQTARRLRCDCVATGHTADDQAETMLLNLVRGTGTSGLAGIPHVGSQAGLRLIRPLRDLTRLEIELYLRQQKLAWREDATNSDCTIVRNRVRHELLPLLEKRFNPAIRQSLCRTGAILAGENQWLESLMATALANCRNDQSQIRAAELAARPLAARRRVIRQWLEDGGLPANHISYETVERIDQLAAQAGGRRSVPVYGSWHVKRSGGHLTLRAATPEPPAAADPILLSVPGTTRLPSTRLEVTAVIEPGTDRTRPAPIGDWPARASLSLQTWRRRRLTVRAWQPGDRMRPLGLKGSKKLQDLFSDKKVPFEWRQRLPIFVCGGEIVWIPGFRIAEGWQVSAKARLALQLTVNPG